jgi:hypothetical protein
MRTGLRMITGADNVGPAVTLMMVNVVSAMATNLYMIVSPV